MSYKELLEHKHTAVQGMAQAKDEWEKSVWIIMHRWACTEIKALTVSNTISA